MSSDAISATGIVLTAMPIGDYDKRITILTLEYGKITAFARGARRPKSSLLACTNPFAFGTFSLFPGKNAYTLQKADISNYFRELTADPMAAYYGFYFCEFAEYCCQENNDERDMLKLVYQTLRALQKEKLDKRLVRLAFEDKAMTINGIGPNVFSCVRCGRKEPLISYYPDKGGLYCSSCASFGGGIGISDATRYTLQYIASSTIEKLYTFQVSEEVLLELESVIESHIRRNVRHTFKSLEVLEELT